MALDVLDEQVRLAVYRLFVDTGQAPVPAEVAAAVGIPIADAEDAFRRLADAHVLVLAPGTPYIWMANPLCALPSPYRVDAGGRPFFGICIWDALGILGLLGTDGTVSAACPDCGEPLRVEVSGGRVSGDGLVHYAVPAAHWWDDIGFN